jgi:malonyl-CoA O-methyltransferase
MFDSNKINRNFGSAALTYDDNAQLQPLVRQDCENMAAPCWPAGSRILDIGCGTGAFSRNAAGTGWHIVQTDLSEGMCRKASEYNPATAGATAEALPFADAGFDGVFSSLMLQWVYDPLPALREMARVVRPGGVCVLSTLVNGTLHELRDAFASLDDVPRVNAFAYPAPLTALCAHAGFKLLNCEEETITLLYPSLTALLRSLKSIGAHTTQGPRKHGLMTPRQLASVEAHYRSHHAADTKKNELPATWQVLYMLMERNP